MRFQRYVLGLIPICCFNVIYFIWQPFNKHLLPLFESVNPAADFFTNIIYYILWFSIILIISKTCFPTNILEDTPIRILKQLAILVGVQFISDLVKLIIYFGSDFVCCVAGTVLDTVSFALMLFIIIRKEARLKKKHYLALIIGSILLVVIFLIFLNEVILIKNEMTYIEQKYLNGASVFSMAQRNSQFRYELMSMLFETIAFGFVYSILYFLFHDTTDVPKVTRQNIVVFALRIMLLIGGMSFVNIKLLLIPASSLTKFQFYDSTNYTNTEFYNEADIETDATFLFRKAKSHEQLVYSSAVVTIKYNGSEIDHFAYNYAIHHKEDYTNAIEYKCFKNSFNDSGLNFQIYSDVLVVYINENMNPVIVYTKDFAQKQEDLTLTKICKIMVEKKDWNYFEFCAEYLLKYDKEFIIPYIERYVENEFSKEEKSLPYNDEVRTEYIYSVASKLSDKYLAK